MCKRSVLLAALLMGIVPVAFGATTPTDTDADGVPDFVEAWLQRNGVAVSPTVSNIYDDTDGDGIPDLVETNVTKTNPAVDDRNICAGGGTPLDVTGQWDIRSGTSPLSPTPDFLTQGFEGISICHTGTTPTVYHPLLGYADTVSYTGGPTTYNLTITWNNGAGPGVSFVVNGTCTSPCTTATGTYSVGGVPTGDEFTMTNRTTLTGSTGAQLTGSYGFQGREENGPPSPSANNPRHLSTFAAQLYVSGSQARIYGDFDPRLPVPGYYIPSVGTFFVFDHFVEDDGDKEFAKVHGMFVAIPSAGAGGMVRGKISIIEDASGGGSSTSAFFIYGKASTPKTFGLTLNTSIGLFTRFALNNVPLSADSATISGGSLPSTTVFNDLDGDDTNNIVDALNIRNRFPGFTNGESVGLAGNGNDINVSNIRHDHTTNLATGTYTFTFAGDIGGITTVDVNHIDYSSAPLPIVTGAALDGTPMTPGRAKGLQNVDLNSGHTLTWTGVNTGGIGNNGIGSTGVYRIQISRSDGDKIFGVVTDMDSFDRFITASGAGCGSGGTCTVSLPAGVFENPGVGYRILIEARDDGDTNNRSRTDHYYLNTPRFRNADFNGDRKADIVWRQASTGANVLWLMDGFSTTAAQFIGGDLNWTPLRFFGGDYNQDAKADILWRENTSGVTVMWQMDGFSVIAAQHIGGDTDWSVVRTGDFNGDGRSDLVWRSASTGATVIWLMNGSTVLAAQFIGGDADWQLIRSGDYNGDRNSDILWRHNPTGTVVMWLMDGFTVLSAQAIGGDADWSVVQNGDFNSDGKHDLLWRNASTGNTVMWLMDGFNVIGSQFIGGDLDWQVRKTGDYNGDGKRDILWRSNSTGATIMWLMDGFNVVSEQFIGGDTDWIVQ